MYKTLQEALGLGGVDLNYLRDVVVKKGKPVSGYTTDYRNLVPEDYHRRRGATTYPTQGTNAAQILPFRVIVILTGRCQQ